MMNTDANAANDRAPARILVVEDEAVVALDLQGQLQDMHYEVCGVADNGEDAIAYARSRRPNLILMDIVIKGALDGIEAAGCIGRSLQIPVIFLTAYSDDSTVARAARTASYGYLTKPFQPRELRAAIEVALYKAALERQLRESEQWFAATLRCVGDGVVATNEVGAVRFMNPVAEALIGCVAADALGRDAAELLQLKDGRSGAPLECPAHRALREGAAVGIDFGSALVSRSGDEVRIDDSAAPIRGDDGQTLGAVMVFRDVRDRLAFEERLRQSEERFRNAFDFAPVGMALVGLDKRFLQVNAAICAMLGASEVELLAASQDDFSMPAELAGESRLLNEVLSGQSVSAQFEKRYRRKDGSAIWALVSVSLLRKGEAPLCWLWQTHDLTERKNAEWRLARLAHFDPLTGLANRAWLNDEIERQIAVARRRGQRFAVVFIDLDHFKGVNDSLGHEAGDELLKLVAAKLRAALRETDSVARLGGDEFVMLLPEVRGPEDVLVVTDKVQIECARPVMLAGQEISIGISVGVSLFPDDAQDARTLLRYADSALYHAKAEGRNTLRFYQPELTARVEQRMKLGAGLRLALRRGELEAYYQPLVRLADGKVESVEALVRWHHPTMGLLQPNEFIALAEETGLSVPIGDWMLHEACRQAAGWDAAASLPLSVAVNVSPRQFSHGDLVAVARNAIEESGLPPQRLCLEITEQLLLDHSEANLDALARLREMGMSIAIDDFGSGYSSLSYIRRFHPSKMKIDISLIRHVAESGDDAALVRAAIAMAHQLQVQVVAEGVESAMQEAFLKAEGCDIGQGFLYSKPLPAAQMLAWITQRVKGGSA